MWWWWEVQECGRGCCVVCCKLPWILMTTLDRRMSHDSSLVRYDCSHSSHSWRLWWLGRATAHTLITLCVRTNRWIVHHVACTVAHVSIRGLRWLGASREHYTLLSSTMPSRLSFRGAMTKMDVSHGVEIVHTERSNAHK